MVAIENKQAAIKGLPCIGDQEASSITRMVLALRGINGKEQIEAWEQGELRVAPQKLKLQSFATGWQQATPMKEDWVAKRCKEKEEEREQRDKRKKLKRDAEQDEAQEGQDQEEDAEEVRESLKKEMPLKDIACPKCGSRQRTEQMRLVTKAGFSNIMCKGCGEVSSSHLWKCRCQHRWPKCGIRLHNVDSIQRNGSMRI